MNSKYAKWKRENGLGKKSWAILNPHMVLPKTMCEGMDGPVAKVKRIAEKNAAKGQNSLSKFFGGLACNEKGMQSNKAAFEAYAIRSNAYSDKMLGKTDEKNNPEDDDKGAKIFGQRSLPTLGNQKAALKPPEMRPREEKSFLKNAEKNKKMMKGASNCVI